METLKNSNVKKPLPVSINQAGGRMIPKIVQTIHFTKKQKYLLLAEDARVED